MDLKTYQINKPEEINLKSVDPSISVARKTTK